MKEIDWEFRQDVHSRLDYAHERAEKVKHERRTKGSDNEES